ncbi:MAG: cytidylate kinase-like family protein [Syntrophaceae bacterium]
MSPETIDQLVQEQLEKWKLADQERRTAKTVITISREPGCNGAYIAAKLAREFKLDLYAGKIVEEVAKSTRMTTAVIESLDEKNRSMLDDWISMLDPAHSLWSQEYMHHLARLIGTVARHGRAVILGRGANFLIEPERQLRIRVIAPLEARIQNVMNRFGASRQEAEKRIKQVESDRKGYIHKYFKMDIAGPIHYDLVINTAFIGDDAIIAITRAGLKSKNLIS